MLVVERLLRVVAVFQIMTRQRPLSKEYDTICQIKSRPLQCTLETLSANHRAYLDPVFWRMFKTKVRRPYPHAQKNGLKGARVLQTMLLPLH